MHYLVGIVVTIGAFLAAFAVFNGMDKILEQSSSRVLEYMHPLAAAIALWVLKLLFWFGSAFLAELAYFAVIPARCPKCGNRSYRYRERRQWGTYLRFGEWIVYRCRSCGHIQSTGWYERGG